MVSDKPKRNVVRDTPCPTCGQLFFKHAVRIHTPFCKGKRETSTDAAAVSPPGRATAPAGFPAAAPAASRAKSDDWVF